MKQMNDDLEFSGLREECGVAGIVGDQDAANVVYLALYAQQHRGQEGCGIVVYDQDGAEETGRFHVHKSFGLVADSFDASSLQKLVGNSALGHVRYSTHGGRLIQNVQPFNFRTAHGPMAIAHNGNLTNADLLRTKLEEAGSIFQSTSDTEVFMHLIARSQAATPAERIASIMSEVDGAYSMVILAQDTLFAVRDPQGFRPLVLGKRDKSWLVVSETCALDLVGAEYVREVEPGELLELRPGEEPISHRPLDKQKPAFCSFEPIYFSRPDSLVFGEVVYQLRKKMGTILAREHPAPDADLVIAVPDSGVPMAMGFAEEAGLPQELGLVRNHYVGRTFIQPAQEIRDFGVKLKLNPVVSALKGKSVVVVDDSIVRGTTSVKIMRMLREAGVRRIHMRIGSPPITHSCYYGVDTPSRERLLAAQKDAPAIREFIGCDSIGYLSVDGLREALADQKDQSYCTACFDGQYRAPIHDEVQAQPTDAKSGPGFYAD